MRLLATDGSATREHIVTSARLAGWPIETGDLMYRAGVSPPEVARRLSDALRPNPRV
jgi:hypothetical protein